MASSLIDEDHNYKALSRIDDELRIVMVGKTGAGKSALGNSLLQSKVFKSMTSTSSITKQCTFGSRHLDNGKKIIVVDTPGIFDTNTDNLKTRKEIVRCIGLSSPGPHIFAFVMMIGRYTQEEMVTIQQLKDLFGEDVLNHVILVFNGKDSLDFDDVTIGQHIEDSSENLKSLVNQCQGRIATINNRATPLTALEHDVKAILDLMDEIVRKHDGGYYTNVMFEGAERAYQEKLKSLEEEKHKKERELEQRVKQKMKEIEDMKQENDKKEEEMNKAETEQDKKERELKEEREKLNFDLREVYRKHLEENDGPVVSIARGIEHIGGGLANLPRAALTGLIKGLTNWKIS